MTLLIFFFLHPLTILSKPSTHFGPALFILLCTEAFPQCFSLIVYKTWPVVILLQLGWPSHRSPLIISVQSRATTDHR